MCSTTVGRAAAALTALLAFAAPPAQGQMMMSGTMQQQMRVRLILAQVNALRQQEAVLAATLQQVNARLAVLMGMRPSGSRNVQILILEQQRANLVAGIQQLQARIAMLLRML
jgi:hypothetical protein